MVFCKQYKWYQIVQSLIISIKRGQFGPPFPDIAVWTAKGKDNQHFLLRN